MEYTTNYHTHTVRSHHAHGTERDYIDTALAHGLTALGFSDHSPYVFPGDFYSGFRMNWESQEDYVNTLLALREEYRGKIDIKVGYELEYYPKHIKDTVTRLLDYPLDYLILGQHFTNNEYDGSYTPDPHEKESDLASYVDQVIEAMDTGIFSIIAHPDVFYFSGDGALFDRHYSRLIEHAKEKAIPLEINFGGMRLGRTYPCERFFALCGEIGAPVCCGADAHDPEDIYDIQSLTQADSYIQKYNLIFIEKPDIKPVHRI